MAFNFIDFVDTLREDETGREIITEYESFFGTMKGGIKDQIWYKEYVSKFDCSNCYQAEIKIDSVETKLIYQLLVASHNLSLQIRKYFNLIDIGVLVVDNDYNMFSASNSATAFLSKLSENKMLELLEIALEDQLTFQIFNKKYPVQVNDIRKKRLDSWKKNLALLPLTEHVNSIESEILSCLS